MPAQAPAPAMPPPAPPVAVTPMAPAAAPGRRGVNFAARLTGALRGGSLSGGVSAGKPQVAMTSGTGKPQRGAALPTGATSSAASQASLTGDAGRHLDHSPLPPGAVSMPASATVEPGAAPVPSQPSAIQLAPGPGNAAAIKGADAAPTEINAHVKPLGQRDGDRVEVTGSRKDDDPETDEDPGSPGTISPTLPDANLIAAMPSATGAGQSPPLNGADVSDAAKDTPAPAGAFSSPAPAGAFSSPVPTGTSPSLTDPTTPSDSGLSHISAQGTGAGAGAGAGAEAGAASKTSTPGRRAAHEDEQAAADTAGGLSIASGPPGSAQPAQQPQAPTGQAAATADPRTELTIGATGRARAARAPADAGPAHKEVGTVGTAAITERTDDAAGFRARAFGAESAQTADPNPVPPNSDPAMLVASRPDGGIAASANLSLTHSPATPAALDRVTASAPGQLDTPASQVAPALMAVARSPDGGRRMTLRLNPEELGRVEIRIDRPASGPARVEITVEKTDTLNLLLHDQQQLQRALDQAGVPPDGRSVTFHVATPEPSMAGNTHGGDGTATSSGGGEGRAGSGFRQGGTGQNGGGAQDENHTLPVTRWLRAGVDITA